MREEGEREREEIGDNMVGGKEIYI
jgi:hypothetical protein